LIRFDGHPRSGARPRKDVHDGEHGEEEAAQLRADDFDGFFDKRMQELVALIEGATGKPVQHDLDEGNGTESLQQFDPEDAAVVPDLDDLEVDSKP
jgi:hypothetical protein